MKPPEIFFEALGLIKDSIENASSTISIFPKEPVEVGSFFPASFSDFMALATAPPDSFTLSIISSSLISPSLSFFLYSSRNFSDIDMPELYVIK